MSGTLPSQLGPYRVLSLLGRGGMGVVYLAHDLTGRPVALKTLEGISREDARWRGIQQEIAALRRLRHPGVVQVEADGFAEGQPWFAMELLRGPSLRTWLNQRGLLDEAPEEGLTQLLGEGGALASQETHPDPPPAALLQERSGVLSPAQEEALRLLCQIAHTLAYLHGEGVVHCDLKPDNVVLADEGRRGVLIDLGLAVHRGERVIVDPEHLEGAGGSIAYLCPQRLCGAPFDARSDLYALGCMLYEILTGRPPFVGKTMMQIALGHLQRPPLPPSQQGLLMPPLLEGLVMALLAKEPAQRPGHASVVVETLSTLGLGRGYEAPCPAARPYLYTPPLVGRDALEARLEERLEATLARPRLRALVLSGESGIGKSALARRLVRATQQRRCLFLAAVCPPLEHATSLGGLESWLEQAWRASESHGEAARARVWSPSKEALHAAGLWPGQARDPEACDLDARAQPWLVHAIVGVLERLALEGPLVTLLEDLQHLAPLPRSVLQELLRIRRPGLPWLLVATLQSDAAAPSTDILRSAHVELMPLPQLTAAEAQHLLKSCLGADALPEGLSQLARRSAGGNPWKLQNFLSWAIEEGILHLDARGRWLVRDTRLEEHLLLQPGLAEAVLKRRLERLEPLARRLLELITLAGVQLTGAELAQMTEAPPEAIAASLLSPALHLLVDAHAGEVQLHREGLRAELLALLPSEGRAGLHRAIARRLAARRAAHEAPGALAWEARHWQLGEEPLTAAGLYLMAARAARRLTDLKTAETLYRDALALLPDDAAAWRYRAECLEDVVFVRSSDVEAAQALEQLLAEVPAGVSDAEQARLQARLGELYVRSGEHPRGLALLRQALQRCERAGSTYEQAHVLIAQGAALFWAHKRQEGLETLQDALQLTRQRGDRRGEAKALHIQALHLLRMGRLPEARARWEEALDLHRLLGDAYMEAASLNNLAVIAEGPEAGALLERVVALRRDLCDRRGLGMSLANLARHRRLQGQVEQVQGLVEEGLRIAEVLGDRRMSATLQNVLAELLSVQGRYDAARFLLQSVIAEYEAIDARRDALIARIHLLYIDLQRGPLEGLGAAMSALERELEEDTPMERAYLEGLQGQLALKQGRLEEAAPLLARALAWAEEHHQPFAAVDNAIPLARLERERGALDRAAALLTRWRPTLDRLGLQDALVLWCVERGLLDHAQGVSGHDALQEARARLATLQVTPAAETAQRVATLEASTPTPRDE